MCIFFYLVNFSNFGFWCFISGSFLSVIKIENWKLKIPWFLLFGGLLFQWTPEHDYFHFHLLFFYFWFEFWWWNVLMFNFQSFWCFFWLKASTFVLVWIIVVSDLFDWILSFIRSCVWSFNLSFSEVWIVVRDQCSLKSWVNLWCPLFVTALEIFHQLFAKILEILHAWDYLVKYEGVSCIWKCG